MEYLLGIDVGSSSLKAVLLDRELRAVALAEKGYVSRGGSGCTALDAGILYAGVLRCLDQLEEKVTGCLGGVAGIGISCMCPGLCAIGADGGAATEIILYSDRRSISQAEWFSREAGEERIFAVTGNRAMAGATSVTSMLWIKENLPEAYRACKGFGHINTLLISMMCGTYVIDPSNASYTGLYDTANGGWDEKLCTAAGIPSSMLPEVVESAWVAGKVRCREMNARGIRTGVPVVAGGADTPCAALACGAYRAGHACDSSGTTNVLSIVSDRAEFNPAFLNRRHVLEGLWIHQGVMSNAGVSRDWAARLFCPSLLEEAGPADAYRRLDELAASSSPGAGGVLFLPYLTGERSPVWDAHARGVFLGMGPDTSREDMLRAVWESTGYGLEQLLMSAPVGEGPLACVGGGARSAFSCQLKADITGRTFNVMNIDNASATGAAMLAGIGTGLYRDGGEAFAALGARVRSTYAPKASCQDREAYRRAFKVYSAIYPAVKPLFGAV